VVFFLQLQTIFSDYLVGSYNLKQNAAPSVAPARRTTAAPAAAAAAAPKQKAPPAQAQAQPQLPYCPGAAEDEKCLEFPRCAGHSVEGSDQCYLSEVQQGLVTCDHCGEVFTHPVLLSSGRTLDLSCAISTLLRQMQEEGPAAPLRCPVSDLQLMQKPLQATVNDTTRALVSDLFRVELDEPEQRTIALRPILNTLYGIWLVDLPPQHLPQGYTKEGLLRQLVERVMEKGGAGAQRTLAEHVVPLLRRAWSRRELRGAESFSVALSAISRLWGSYPTLMIPMVFTESGDATLIEWLAWACADEGLAGPALSLMRQLLSDGKELCGRFREWVSAELLASTTFLNHLIRTLDSKNTLVIRGALACCEAIGTTGSRGRELLASEGYISHWVRYFRYGMLDGESGAIVAREMMSYMTRPDLAAAVRYSGALVEAARAISQPEPFEGGPEAHVTLTHVMVKALKRWPELVYELFDLGILSCVEAAVTARRWAADSAVELFAAMMDADVVRWKIEVRKGAKSAII
jgi:hypothetical protein